MKPKIPNKKGQSLLQRLIDGTEMGKQAKANHDVKQVGEIAKSAAPFIEKLIPLLPDAEIRGVYTHALNMLKPVNKQFDEGKGSFKALSPFIAYLTNGIKQYLANKS